MSFISMLLLLFLGWLAIGLTVPVPQGSGKTEGILKKKEDIVKFLRNVTLLRNLSDDQISKIADKAEVKSYPAGAQIAQERSIGYVVSHGGPVSIYEQSYHGRSQEVQKLRSGDFFAIPAQPSHANSTLTLTAEADVEGLLIDQRAFDEIVGEQNALHKIV